MAESLELLFGMTGDSAVASRINALNRSFKSLDRTAKGFSRLATGAASLGALRGGIQGVFSPENLALLNRHIIRPITLDMRKLARYIKTHPALKRAGSFLSNKASQIANSEVMKKIKDYMDVNFKKLSSAIGSQLKKLAPALSRLSSFTGGVIGYVGAKVIPFLSTNLKKASYSSSLYLYRNMQDFISSKFKKARFEKFMQLPLSQKLNKIQSRVIASTIAQTYGKYKLFTGFGRVGDGFRNSITKRQEELYKNIRNSLARFGGKTISYLSASAGARLGSRAIGAGKASYAMVLRAATALFPYATLAAAVGGIIAVADKRVSALVAKWTQKGEYYLGKALSMSATGWSYMIKSVAYGITGSKHQAFDSSKLIAEEIKNRGVNSPQELKRWFEHNLKLNNEKWQSNNEDFKNNLIMEINALSEKRLKPIDDLMYTQLRDSRL